MEKDSPSKPSVAELAGRFKGIIVPVPTSNDELPFRRRPLCSLKVQNQKDDNEESDKTNPFKIKMKNSPIIEKLQANLALSPTALLPSSKNPEVKLQPAPLSPTTPRSPPSPTLKPLNLSPEEEDPVGFTSPPEGTPLPSINKTRARLSFKRRPPTRQHRRSARDEDQASAIALSPCELYGPKENGDEHRVLDSPVEEASLTEAEEKDRDCDPTEDEVAKGEPDNRNHLEEEVEQVQSLDTSEEEHQHSEPSPAKQIDGDAEGREEMVQKEQETENNQM